ncbi:MAG: aminopeptidase P family protein, partial [Marmoricola sp.]
MTDAMDGGPHSDVESHTESHDPTVPEAYSAFMRTGWGERELDVAAHPITDWARARRERLAEQFPGERLVVPSGGFKVRSNDCDYRFRSSTAHTYLCGNQTSDAVLVIQDGEAVLYARPRSSRDTDEFFRDRQYGELWVGRRPSLKEISDSLGVQTRHIDELSSRLSGSAKTRVLRGLDARVDAEVSGDAGRDTEFARVLSELRLVKDAWEIGELQGACDITTLGFEDSVREWDRVLEHGERWIEGTFFRRARAMGHDIGYDSIVGGGRHATTLHWIENSGPVTPGNLLLLDMGAEASSLYTADVTHTLPVDGAFTSVQRDLYSLVLAAQQAGLDVVRPGAAFRAPHEAAMSVLAHGLDDLGLLPVS